MLCVQESSVLHFSPVSAPLLPAHAVIVDDSRKQILLLVRGTSTWADCLTDIVAHTEPLGTGLFVCGCVWWWWWRGAQGDVVCAAAGGHVWVICVHEAGADHMATPLPPLGRHSASCMISEVSVMHSTPAGLLLGSRLVPAAQQGNTQC